MNPVSARTRRLDVTQTLSGTGVPPHGAPPCAVAEPTLPRLAGMMQTAKELCREILEPDEWDMVDSLQQKHVERCAKALDRAAALPPLRGDAFNDGADDGDDAVALIEGVLNDPPSEQGDEVAGEFQATSGDVAGARDFPCTWRDFSWHQNGTTCTGSVPRDLSHRPGALSHWSSIDDGCASHRQMDDDEMAPVSEMCMICLEPAYGPVYGELADGRPCDDHCASGHHVACSSCYIRHMIMNGATCPRCCQPVAQLQQSGRGPISIEWTRSIREKLDVVGDRTAEDDDPTTCVICGEGETTPSDELFKCQHDDCPEAWHRLCGRIPSRFCHGNHTCTWCSDHEPAARGRTDHVVWTSTSEDVAEVSADEAQADDHSDAAGDEECAQHGLRQTLLASTSIRDEQAIHHEIGQEQNPARDQRRAHRNEQREQHTAEAAAAEQVKQAAAEQARQQAASEAAEKAAREAEKAKRETEEAAARRKADEAAAVWEKGAGRTKRGEAAVAMARMMAAGDDWTKTRDDTRVPMKVRREADERGDSYRIVGSDTETYDKLEITTHRAQMGKFMRLLLHASKVS